MTYALDSLRDALRSLDDELTITTRRRDLVLAAIAAFTGDEDDDDDDQVTLVGAPDLAAAMVAAAAKPAPTASVSRSPKPKRSMSKWDWPEIGSVARDALDNGDQVAAVLAKRYGVPMTTGYWMVKRCRELGHLPPSSRERFITTPIERTPFDPEASRDAAAGPAVGKVRPITGNPGRRTDLDGREPAVVVLTPARFTTDDALAALGG